MTFMKNKVVIFLIIIISLLSFQNTNAHYFTHKLKSKDSIVQFLFTSDLHFGLVKEKFQAKQQVSAYDVNLAMVKVMNQFKNIDALIITGDIANRMEGGVQTATKSWSEFEKVFIDSLHLKNRYNQKSKLWVIPGNHDMSNAIGFHRPMYPKKDPASMLGIHNLMFPQKKAIIFDSSLCRIHYSKDINVLEYLNKVPAYKGKVAAFSTWDVFPYILNEKRSGVYVNADADSLSFKEPSLNLLNEMQFLTAKPINLRPDIITYFAAKEYLKSYHPSLIYISFDETDDYAHSGMYDQYLKSLHAEDAMISNLWNTIQSIPQYKNNTNLIITCDHGRGGTGKSTWKNHGQEVKESSEIWLAAMGPKIQNLGEVKVAGQFYQKQIASTIAKLMEQDFNETIAKHPVGEPLNYILK